MRHLPEYMVPSQFLVVEALPKTPNGKVDRQALSVLAGGAPAVPRTSPASAGDRLEAQIADIWRRVLRISDVANDDNFFALGGHSLSAVVVATYLSQALGTRVPPAVIIQHQTIKAIARQLGSTLGRPAQPMEPMNDIVELQSGVSLFLVHAMGPSASWYRPLARYLGPGTRVFAIEAPGSMDALSSVEAIAATHIQSVRRLQGKGPYRLAGGSLGGVIAYEMARQLESAGEVVSFVGLFDSPFPESAPPQDEAAIMARTFGGIVKASALRGKSSEAQFQLIRDAVQAARSDSPGLPRVLSMLVEDYETWLIQWRRMIALREAVYRYRPGPYEGRTVYFEADRLGFADEDGQKKYLGRWMQRAEKWAGVARQAVIRPFVGTHVDMLSEEFVAEAGGLGEAMRAELSLLERDPSDGDIERQAGGRR
jgi:thioesterase domain-containing protein/acyl carrier protein